MDAGAGNATDLLTHVLHTHYSAPQGFDWEEFAPVVDEGSVASRARQLVDALRRRSAAYRHRHLLVPFGDDFKFRNAELQFSSMTRIIEFVQQREAELGVSIRFSTLSDYFTAAASEGQFPSLQGDFLPYADNEQSYWTVSAGTADGPAARRLLRSPCLICCGDWRCYPAPAGLLHHAPAAQRQVENVRGRRQRSGSSGRSDSDALSSALATCAAGPHRCLLPLRCQSRCSAAQC